MSFFNLWKLFAYTFQVKIQVLDRVSADGHNSFFVALTDDAKEFYVQKQIGQA